MQVSFLTSVKGTSQFLPEMLDSVKDCGVDYEVQIRANGLPEWDAVKFAKSLGIKYILKKITALLWLLPCLNFSISMRIGLQSVHFSQTLR